MRRTESRFRRARVESTGVMDRARDRAIRPLEARARETRWVDAQYRARSTIATTPGVPRLRGPSRGEDSRRARLTPRRRLCLESPNVQFRHPRTGRCQSGPAEA